jgi:hypothetical protein
MRTKMKNALLIALAICATIVVGREAVIAQNPTSSTGEADAGLVAPTGAIGTSHIWSETTNAAVQNLVSRAHESGYSVTVAPGEFGTVDAELTKTGKTPESHGILQRQWDQRETLELKYLPTPTGGLTVFGAERLVEQKPPIGPWTVKSRETGTVPPELVTIPNAGR